MNPYGDGARLALARVLSSLRRVVIPALCVLCSLTAFEAQAAEHRFQLLVDTDNNAATGCAVATGAGLRSGIEQVWTTVVTTSPSSATVSRIERQDCVAGVLGPSSTFATAGWPAGLGNGAQGTAAIETFIPLSSLPAGGTLKVLVASTNATGGQDTTAAFTIVLQGSAPPPSGAAQAIPLSGWLVVPLGLMLFATVAWYRRKFPGNGLLVLCVLLVATSGLVWAAKVSLDGSVGDWSGVSSVAGNPKGTAPVDANIVKVFYQSDANHLYFRIDADVRPDAAANQAPTVSAGADQTITLPASAQLGGSASDDGLPSPPGALTTTWSKVSGPGTVTFADSHALATGATFSQSGVYVVRLTADDGSLNASDDLTLTVNGAANQNPVAQPDSTSTFPGVAAHVNVSSNDSDPNGDTLTVTAFTQGAHGTVSCLPDGDCTYTPEANFTGPDSFTYTVSDGHGGQAIGTVNISVAAGDNTVNAPPLKHGVATIVGRATAFLYSGANPLQTGVPAGAIEDRRAAVLRGKVTMRDGGLLPGVIVSIVGHPEFGQTTTRVNGFFDMAVNGGGPLAINYSAAGFLPVQKQVNVPWQDYVAVPTVALIPLDAQVTAIAASALIAQVHQGSTMTDTDGSRRVIVVFPAGTAATMTLPNGSTQPLTTMHVRATEYTVGPNGPVAMPANLPGLSGYTYCVELSVDEAIAAGAVGVTFSQPVVTYVENFLKFPVGTDVPVGIYDRSKAAWVPSANGRIVKIVSITGGAADVDTDGDGVADSGLGISTDERKALTAAYPAGQALWRVAVLHFSPEDSNWPYSIPTDATSPGDNGAGPDPNNPQQNPKCSNGSIVECENQVLGEALPIVGTPYSLNYRSDRVPGLIASRNIRLSGASVPASLASIDLHVAVAGQTFDQTFPAAANQQMTFVWDRRDAYGREVVGGQTLSVKIDYNYPTTYKEPGPFPAGFNSVGLVSLNANPMRQQINLSQSFTTTIGEGLTDARTIGLGGWTLSAHHVYDPNARVAHLGSGSRRRAGSLARTLTTVPVPGQTVLFDVEVAPDGSQLVALPHGDQIIRVATSGAVSVVAGNGTEGFSGDGGPAAQAMLGDPTGIALAPDGSLYIAEQANFRVRKVSPAGIISTVVGTGIAGFSGDGGPATQAQLSFAERVAVGADSTLYILDSQRVRRVNTDGIINTIAGTGVVGFSGDGGPGTAATLNASSLVAAPDGGVFIADFGNNRVRHVGPDGIIDTVAEYVSEVGRPVSIRPMQDGSLLIALEFGSASTPRVDLLKPDGSIVTIAGGGPSPIQESVPANQVALAAIRATAVGPDGSVFIAPGDGTSRLLRIGPALPGFDGSETIIASPDASQLYVFDAEGRHLKTLNVLTGATLFEFGYDAGGKLATVTEKTGGIDNVTTIQHDAFGNPTAIVGPFGQVTTLAVDTNGFLSNISNPAGEATQITSDAGGLMSSYTDGRGKTSTFAFDPDGRLTRDTDPVGGKQDLSRATSGNQSIVTRTTALGRTTTYATLDLAENTQRRTITEPDGTQSQSEETIDVGATHASAPDGTRSDVLLGPDPRFGMQAPIGKSVSFSLPSNLTLATSQIRTTVLSNASDPLSLVSLTDTSTIGGRSGNLVYTAATRGLITTTPAGRTASLTTDPTGRPTAAEVSGLDSTFFAYDNRGRLVTVTQGSGTNVRTTSFSYGADGYLQSITDPLGRGAHLNYDQASRLTSKTFPDGRIVHFAYDAAGNITNLVPPGRPAHVFTYSDRNELIQIMPPAVPGAGATTYTYDLDKQLTNVSRPDGRAIAVGYDAGGRLVSRTFGTTGAATGTDTLTYDSVGRVSTVATASGELMSYGYDGPLLTSESWAGPISGNVTRNFDSNFRISNESVDGSNTISFVYDDDDLLKDAGDLLIARSAQNGLPTGTVLGSVGSNIAYDGLAQVSSYGITANSSNVFSDSFTRDAVGRIAQKTEVIGGVTDVYGYSYDMAGRLVSVNKNSVNVESYSYDDNGNRTLATVANNTVTATYDDQDRLVQYGGLAFTFSAAGELVGKSNGTQTTAYAYDALGNLLGATLADGTVISYVIDGDNRRLGKKVNGTLVKGFLYSGARVVAELNGAGTVVSRFVYAGGHVPAYMVKGGAVLRFITDQLGSVRLLVDGSTSAILQRIDYDSFGNVIQDTNPGFQPFGFAGGLYEADTGLTHFSRR